MAEINDIGIDLALSSLPPTDNEGHYRIQVNNRTLHEKTLEALHTLLAHNQPPSLFQRGGGLCRLREIEPGKYTIEDLSKPALRGIMGQTAIYYKIKSKGDDEEETVVSPPTDLVENVLALNSWPGIPYLSGIVLSPVLRKDGSLLSKPGYDAASCLFYSKSVDIPNIPENPGKEDAIRAANYVLQEVFGDFPFKDAASEANAFAGLLSPIIRPMIDGCVPMMLVDKPSPGTGASKLMDLIALITTGDPAKMETPPGTEEEWRKKITSLLRVGLIMICLDNIETSLNSRSLSQALTSTIWGDRLLGKSESLSLPQRACWYATGNNLVLKGDIPRRSYLVRMDAKMARPWERDASKFRHPDIVGWVKEHRGELLASLLIMSRAWVVAGRPAGSSGKSIGGFDDWLHILDGILTYAGVPGFLGNLDELYSEADEGSEQWQEFLRTWYGKFGDRALMSKDITKELGKSGSEMSSAAPDEVAEAMAGSASGKEIRVGLALRKKNGVRYSNGFMLVRGKDASSGSNTWQVKEFKVAGS